MFSCEQCNQSFTSKRGLASHSRIHNKESIPEETVAASAESLAPTEPDQHNCDVCKQSFTTHRGLMVHRSRLAKEANNSTAENLIRRTALSADKSINMPIFYCNVLCSVGEVFLEECVFFTQYAVAAQFFQ